MTLTILKIQKFIALWTPPFFVKMNPFPHYITQDDDDLTMMIPAQAPAVFLNTTPQDLKSVPPP